MALAIQAFFHPEQAEGIDETYELHLGKEVLHVQIRGEVVQVQAGPARKPDVVILTEMPCFVALFAGQLEAERAVQEGIVTVVGDPGGLSRFLKLCGVPRSR
jgi:hypothetical protein